MSREVYVIGVGMHPFMRDAPPLREMYFTAASAALQDAGIRFQEVGYLYNGYINGRMQGIGFAKDLGLTNVPVVHVENASATGSCAMREAVNAVKGGHCEVAMAVGFDDMMKFSRARALSEMAEGPKIDSTILPAAFFAMWAVRRMHEHGTTLETFAKIAAKNWNHARFNPMAQRQSKELVTPKRFWPHPKSPIPTPPRWPVRPAVARQRPSSPPRRVAMRVARGRPMVKVVGSQMKSEHYTPGHVFLGAVIGPEDLTRVTTQALYEESGLGPKDVDLVHVHDAFPIEELMYYELMGFAEPGEGDHLVARGDTSIGGKIPFSTDGGLTARGHPGGPTGLAQIWDGVQQLRGESGPRQVAGARNAMIHMMGAGSICVMHMLQRDGDA
jgi:acetyl-CoA acetyltransferase